MFLALAGLDFQLDKTKKHHDTVQLRQGPNGDKERYRDEEDEEDEEVIER